jgi:hypothetical protein
MTRVTQKQYKVCFAVDAKYEELIKNLPRTFNLSAHLRDALTEILERAKENKM